MPNPNPTHPDSTDVRSRADSGRPGTCEPAYGVRLVDPSYRTMTDEEERAAVSAVAALMRALLRAGHRPPADDDAEGDGA